MNAIAGTVSNHQLDGAIPILDARLLTAGGPTAFIRLDGQAYVLRITKAGKLILTK